MEGRSIAYGRRRGIRGGGGRHIDVSEEKKGVGCCVPVGDRPKDLLRHPSLRTPLYYPFVRISVS